MDTQYKNTKQGGSKSVALLYAIEIVINIDSYNFKIYYARLSIIIKIKPVRFTNEK